MTLDEYFSLSRERRDEVYQALSTPEVDARSDAMVERAETYEQRIAEVLSRMVMLLQDANDDSNPLFLLAQLIALDQLRCDALGVPPGCWKKSMQRQGVLQDETIDVLKRNFRMEAVN